MVGAAITTSALQLMLNLAEQKESKRLTLTLAITEAKAFKLDPRPLDVTRNSRSHCQEFAPGTLKHVTLLVRSSHAPMRLGACKASLAFKAGGWHLHFEALHARDFDSGSWQGANFRPQHRECFSTQMSTL